VEDYVPVSENNVDSSWTRMQFSMINSLGICHIYH